jgi:polysaccharide chain length determinant protein (PEP-CTERM system associated)
MDNVDFIKELLLALKFELIKYRVIAFVLATLVLVAIMAVGLTWKDQFTSSTTIEIDDSSIIKPLLSGRAEFSASKRLEEAKGVIMSPALLESVARRLGYISDTSTSLEVQRVLDIITNNLVVSSDFGEASVFHVSYISTDPQVAFDTLSELTSQLLDFHKKAQQKEGENAYSFISKRVDVYKERLENAELDLKKFKSRGDVVDETTVQARINTIQDTMQELELSIREDESIIATTKKQLNVEKEYLETQSVLYTLTKRKQDLEDELSSLRMLYQDSYPDVVTIKQQLSDIQARIDTIALDKNINPRIFSSAESSDSNPEQLFDEMRRELAVDERELSAKKQRLKSLAARLIEERKSMEVVASNQAELSDLMREYNVIKEVYEEMLGRLQNAELSVAITAEGQGLNYGILVKPVYPLHPTGLTFIHFVMAAPVVALGAPIALLLALIIVDPKVRTLGSMQGGAAGEFDLLVVSPRYHTAFGDRMLRKDMLIMSMFAFGIFIAYVGFAVSGLRS